MNSESRMMMESLRNSMMAASEQPQAYAEGGSVSALPTLQDLANPNFNIASFNARNPFAPMTQNVPMSVVQGPAYGSMGTDVYDWKAPTAKAAPQPYSTVNMEAAQTYNRRVPTAAATVNVPMPSVATPAPNVPTPNYVPTMPGVTIPESVAPPVAPPVDDIYTTMPVTPPVAPPPTTPIDSGFTPVTNPLGPTPEEVRRTEAAAALEALKAREAQEQAAREAENARLAEADRIAREGAEAARLAETARLAEADRIAKEAQAAEQARLAEEARLAELQRAGVAARNDANNVDTSGSSGTAVVEEAAPPRQTFFEVDRNSGFGYGEQQQDEPSWYTGGSNEGGA